MKESTILAEEKAKVKNRLLEQVEHSVRWRESMKNSGDPRNLHPADALDKVAQYIRDLPNDDTLLVRLTKVKGPIPRLLAGAIDEYGLYYYGSPKEFVLRLIDQHVQETGLPCPCEEAQCAACHERRQKERQEKFATMARWTHLNEFLDGWYAAPWKVYERHENLRWEEPFIRFEVERHGSTAMGSTFADLHQFEFDARTRHWSHNESKRQLYARAKSVTKQMLTEIVDTAIEAVQQGKIPDGVRELKDGRLVFSALGLLGEHGHGPNQTIEGRASRLKAILNEKLDRAGFVRDARMGYRRP